MVYLISFSSRPFYRIVLWHNSLAGGVLGADHQLIFLCNLKNTGGIVIHGSLNEATHGSMDHPLMMHSLFACQMLRRTKLMKGILSWQAHRYASKQAQVKLWQCSAKLWSAKVANPACVQTSNQWGIPLAARTSSKLGSSCLQMFNWCFIISTNLHYARLWRTSSSCSSKKSNLDSVLQTSGTPGPVLFWWSGSWKYSVLLPVLVLEIRLDFGPILGIPVWNWH